MTKKSDSDDGPIEIQSDHEGDLRAALDVPEGQKIPASKLAAAKNSENPHMRRMATFAANAKKWGK